MIKNIQITNYLGEVLTIEMTSPEKSGFVILSVDGLGPAKASVNTTQMLTSDGSIFNSSRVGQRNIVFKFQFLGTPTIEDTRQTSYRFFGVKKALSIRIETDNRVCKAIGYVESNEPDIFSPEVSTSISVICPSPYFYSEYTQQNIFSGVEPLFIFPFSNNSLTSNLLEMGDIEMNVIKTIFYEGDAAVGCRILLHAIGPATNMSVYNSTTRQLMSINSAKLDLLVSGGYQAGDDIIITTTQGSKSIIHARSGIETNILNALDRDADWIQLERGDNVLIYTAESGVGNIQLQVDNQILYEGI